MKQFMCLCNKYAAIFLVLMCGRVLSTKEDQAHWFNLGKQDIDDAFKANIINRAKNVILFVGDGMDLTTTTVSRIYAKGEAGFLSFEKFPHIGVLKTYNADYLVPDSASTATALFSGIKTNYKTSGVDTTVKLNDCEASLNVSTHIKGIFQWAQDSKKATGFVTTTRVTHATPSALYAHASNRKWECESTVPEDSKQCKDIARQLIEDEPGKNINVIMGGGRQCLQSEVQNLPNDPIDTWACYSRDGRDLINDWVKDKENRKKKHAVVANTEEMFNVPSTTDFLLGIFANGHMAMDYARDKSPKGMPSLSNMTTKAIDILGSNPNGFILVVEGGLIDFGHHRGHARQALDETASLSNAVEAALKKINIQDTLVIVTSDHSHSLVFSGYITRGKNVLDIAQNAAMDNGSYTPLLYGTGGPNNYQYSVENSRVDPALNDTTLFEYSQQSAIPTDEVTHGGSDVLVYAKGPMAHLFHTVHEQTHVAYVIAYALEIGPFKNDSISYSPTAMTFLIVLVCFLKLV